MKDINDCLIIGDTSQLSKCLPLNCDRVSSRNFDSTLVGDYRKIFVCFAEQRTFDNSLDFMKINYDYTLELIDSIITKCDDVVFYSTAMLWENLNNYCIEDEFCYDDSNQYLVSKEKVTRELRDWSKVLIHYPCNFNSTYRKPGYLFSKLVHACQGNEVSTGNLDFNRELAHTSYVAKRSYESSSSEIIASGFLTNVRNYFHDVIAHFDVQPEFIQETIGSHTNKPDSHYKFVDMNYSYENLLQDTIEDIEGVLIRND